jgi:hypothetical protein
MGAMKPIHCFLARGKDEKLISVNASKDWTKHVTKELLEKRVTRSLF